MIIVIIHIVIILNHRLLASSSHLNIWSTKKSELYFQMIWKCMEKQTLGWLGYFGLHFLPSSDVWGLMAGPKFPYQVVAQQGRIIPFSSMAAYHAVVIVPWSPELCMLRHLFKMRMPLLVPELSLLRNLVHVANMRLMPYPYNVRLGGVADFGVLWSVVLNACFSERVPLRIVIIWVSGGFGGHI